MSDSRSRELLKSLVRYFEDTCDCPACETRDSQVVREHLKKCKTAPLCREIRQYELFYGALK